MTPGTTVPAALVGVWEGARVHLLREGAPPRRGVVAARHSRDGYWLVHAEPAERGESSADGFAHAWIAPRSERGIDVIVVDAERMLLDLRDRPTRLEVMARLALRVCPDVGFSGATFEHDPRSFDGRVWCIRAPRSHLNPNWTTEAWGREKAPALADLDPTDDTRLSEADPVRVVDVRALAIVCQHVFGGAS
jgi:hypothetical protein